MRHRTATCIVAALVVAGSSLLGTASPGGPPSSLPLAGLEKPPPADTPPDPGPIVTGFEARGYVSYYRYGDPSFHGGCLAIRDEANWTAFWRVHTWGIRPEPQTPAIDFREETVLVCIFGVSTDCCGSYVNITGVERDGDGYSVSVDMRYRSGVLGMVSNPYHIEAVTRTDGPIRFHHFWPEGPPVPEIPPVP